ncbi:MAG: hypothetical protein HY343_11150, partial [Lentisphaerae bacterium]|nr:hypothetical protein [Lentisphaerota bacterium]
MLDLHFQLAPGPAALEATNRTVQTVSPEGGNVLVWTPPDAPVALIEEKGQTSSKFHVKEARPAFAYRHREQGPAIFLTVIVPFEGGRVPAIEGSFPGMEPGADRLEIGLTVNGVVWTLGRDLVSGDAWCR